MRGKFETRNNLQRMKEGKAKLTDSIQPRNMHYVN